MASRSFFTPPPNATTTTTEGRRTLPRQQQQQQHTTRASERLVDMNSLVWPPPPPTTQQKQRSSSSTAVPNYERRDRHPSNHVSAPTSPLGATKASSSSRRTQLPTATLPPNENRRQTTSSQAPVRQSPSSNSHLPQQRHSSQPIRPHPNVVPQHHHSNHTSPLRPSFIHSNTSPPALGQGNHHYSRRQPYHEDDGKDFSTEEEDSPISHRQHRDYPQQQQHHPHHQQHPSPQPHTYNNNPLPPPPGDSIPFFEPLVTDPLVTNPIPISSHHHDGYLSPVMDGRGRQINGRMCRVPPNLGPGGVIQQGWPKEYIQHAWPSVGGATGGGSRTPTMTMQSPLRYGGPTLEEEEESESSDSDSHDSQEDETDQHPPPLPTTRVVSPGRTPPLPTRRGYWNRRGDTIGETGHIRPAPPTQTFPPDLAHYPEYALMNEIGEVTLPATCVERVLSWRECRD